MKAHLDANAGAPLTPEVRETVARCLADQQVNPSGFAEPSRRVRDQIEAARAEIAAAFGADPIEIIFTSGGSEAINTALASVAYGKLRSEIISSPVEHSATLSALELHADAKLLTVDGNALVDPSLRDANLEEADLISLLWANNEVGTLNDVTAIDTLCGAADLPLHLDAVCAAGKIPIDLHALPNLTFASFSAHKFHGLAGVGALYVRRGTRFTPLIAGGHQERGRRAGTENLLGIISMAAALRGDLPARTAQMLAMRERFEAGLAQIAEITIHGAEAARLPNTTSVAIHGLIAPELLKALDACGVYASAGSACTTGSLEPSHVLRAMGVEDEAARATLRFSTSGLTSAAEIDHALNVIEELLGR